MKENIYTLADPFLRDAPRFSIEDGTAEAWHSAIRGVSPIAALTAFHFRGGRRLRDFLWLGLSGIPLISTRVVEALVASGATGWGTYPVSLRWEDGDAIPGYVGLSVLGRCAGRIGFDRRESALVVRKAPSGKMLSYFAGLKFDRDSWDRTDIFMDSGGSGWILMTDRATSAFDEGNFKNWSHESIDDIYQLADESTEKGQ